MFTFYLMYSDAFSFMHFGWLGFKKNKKPQTNINSHCSHFSKVLNLTDVWNVVEQIWKSWLISYSQIWKPLSISKEIKLLEEWTKGKGGKMWRDWGRQFPCTVSETKDSECGYFPHGQRALCRENHNKNALIEIIQEQELTTCITFACLYIWLFKHYRVAAAACNSTSSWSLRAARCVCVMSLSVSWLFNILRPCFMERLAAN